MNHPIMFLDRDNKWKVVQAPKIIMREKSILA